MSVTVNVAHVHAYTREVQRLAQQSTTKLRSSFEHLCKHVGFPFHLCVKIQQ